MPKALTKHVTARAAVSAASAAPHSAKATRSGVPEGRAPRFAGAPGTSTIRWRNPLSDKIAAIERDTHKKEWEPVTGRTRIRLAEAIHASNRPPNFMSTLAAPRKSSALYAEWFAT